jgi:hypothetical protein
MDDVASVAHLTLMPCMVKGCHLTQQTGFQHAIDEVEIEIYSVLPGARKMSLKSSGDHTVGLSK